MLLVGAPGRMRNGSRLPLVTSRTKKFASLPAMSQVCTPQPPLAFCSRRCAGVLPVLICTSSAGDDVRSPSLPLLSTNIELVAAPAVIVNGVLPPVESSMENLLAPPDALSFAMMRQSFFG